MKREKLKQIFLALLFFALSCKGSDGYTTTFSERTGFYKGVLAPESYNCAASHEQSTASVLNTSTKRSLHNYIPSTYAHNLDKPVAMMFMTELEEYFHSASSAELFSTNNIAHIRSDSFVAYLKRFPEYEGYIEHFHEKFHKSSRIKQWLRKEVGKRLCQLHEELEREKKMRHSKARLVAQEQRVKKQLLEQHTYLCGNWKQLYTAGRVYSADQCSNPSCRCSR
jgi:hypothetical protein